MAVGSLVAILALFTSLWLVSTRLRDASILDILWGPAFLIAAGAGGWWTIFAPVLMTFLLVRVSGVALLERGLAARRPGYADYVRGVPAFIPRPPR